MRRLMFAFLVGVGFAAIATADPPKSQSLKEFVAANSARHAIGLYVNNVKVGYVLSERALGKYQGQDVAIETSDTQMSLVAEGEKSVSREREKIYYSLEGNGPIIRAEKSVMQDRRETKYLAIPAEKGMTLTVNASGESTSRQIPQPRATLANTRDMVCWLKAGPKKGDSFEHWETSWEDDDVNCKEIIHFESKKSILWRGVPTDVFKVKIDEKGAVLDSEILASGDPIHGKLGGLLEMRAESEETVRKITGDLDMTAATSIRVDMDLGSAQSISALKLEVVGMGDYNPPTSHRQKIHRENGHVYIELYSEFRAEKEIAISEAERKKFTSATATIQCDSPKVRQLAADIIGNEVDPLNKADRIKTWVFQNIRKTAACNSNTTLGVLDNMAGDCTEHTLLFVSLARAVGLPARELTGVAYIDRVFGWHAWAEVHNGRQWVGIDPTWNELFVDATHIVLSNDNDNQAWMNILGNVSFRAMKAERRAP